MLVGKGKMQAKVNLVIEKITTNCFCTEKKIKYRIFLPHFSDAYLEKINFMVQFSDTFVYRSRVVYGFCK